MREPGVPPVGNRLSSHVPHGQLTAGQDRVRVSLSSSDWAWSGAANGPAILCWYPQSPPHSIVFSSSFATRHELAIDSRTGLDPNDRRLRLEQNAADRRIEAALVVTVPEAEPLVGSFRLEHDPVAARGMPAHITINYPFVPGIKANADTLTRLSRMFAAMQPFSFTLDHIGRFPNVLYLAPVPSAPFVQMVERTAQEFPESPPYGGRHKGSTPHLTVAQSKSGDLLPSIETELTIATVDHLPLKAFADRVWLMDNSAGRWEKRLSFTLDSK